jgi:hypothetical protein
VIPRFSLRALLPALSLLLVAGCTIPTPGYRKVDQTSPAFKETSDRLAERLRSQGLSEEAAEKKAVRDATRQAIASQKENRPKQIVPLLDALDAFDQSRGCWAYTVTTTTTTDGKLSMQVENFDASQPESRIWTLVSRDGRTPDEQAQNDYREKKISRWKKSLTRAKPRHMDREHVTHDAIFADLKIDPEDANRRTKFTFTREKMSLPVLATINGMRITYLLDNSSGQLLGLTQWIGADSVVLGIKVLHFDVDFTYTLIEPSLPPFLARVSARHHVITLSKDHGEVDQQIVYSDYRRVKCFDHRFEVRVGTPEVQDFLPE